MVRAEYNSIIYNYLAIEQEIMEIDSGFYPAMEADAPQGTTTSTTTTQTTTTVTPTTTNTSSNTGQNTNNTNNTNQNNNNANKPQEINAQSEAKNAEKEKENSTNDQVKKQTALQKALKAVREFLRKIGAIIEEVGRWIINRARAVMGNDEGFKRLYNERKRTVKPQESVSVISYTYHNAKLEQPMQTITNDIKNCLRALSLTEGDLQNGRVSEIINAPQGKMIETLFAPYAKDSKDPINTAPLFVKYLVGNYRGEKAERTYLASDIPNIEPNAMSTRDISNRCKMMHDDCEKLYKNLRKLESSLTASATEEQIKLYKENARKATVLYNTFSSLIRMYFEVRLETSMNYRIILKKFYQMM